MRGRLRTHDLIDKPPVGIPNGTYRRLVNWGDFLSLGCSGRTPRLMDHKSIRDKIMKAIVSFASFLFIFILQAVYAANPEGERAMASFVNIVNAYKTDTKLFVADKKPLRVHGRFGDYTIDTFRLTSCHPTALKNVVAQLKRFDTDAEIPRIWRIFYDGCAEVISANDKGDIDIPNTTSPVWITFELQGLKRTKWKKAGSDSVFVGKPSTSAISPPVSPAALPCGGTVIRNDDTSISFPMCSYSSQKTFYAYALHLDQIGSDGVGVDIGIDPQIINHPPLIPISGVLPVSTPFPTYWAFLSYCSHDRAAARWLQRALETYPVPRRFVGSPTPAGAAPDRFRPIFRDRTELAADADLGARIEGALAQSAYLIVLCSPQAAESHWVDKEIVYFRAIHGATRVLSIIVGDSSTRSHHDCFPAALRYRADSGGAATGPEPIAADLRPGGDGRRMGRLKLVAGMLGVGLDELVRRDAQRRHRRLVIIAAGSVAGMAGMAALATAALLARNEAQRQRGHAESLIEFMLTDLRKKLEPGGHLELMDGVGSEALRYYKAQDLGELDPESLGRRARALRLMGEISVQRGDLGEALKSFEQASATTDELLVRSPADGQRIFNHAQNVFWVGEVARQRGDVARAEVSFQEYRRLAERLSLLDPDNNDWRAEIGYAESALGVLFLQEGRSADAIEPFKRSLAVDEELTRRIPGDPNQRLNLGQGHAWLADALEKQGLLVQARSHRETELAIYRAILNQDHTIRQAKFSTIVALESLGRLNMIKSDLKAAIDDFNDSAGRAEALLIDERENMDLTSVVAITQIELGEALLGAEQVDGARAAQKRSAALLAIALARNMSVPLWRGYRDRAVLLEAAVMGRIGDRTQALRLDQEILQQAETGTGARVNTEPFWLLQRCRLQTGDDLFALGRPDDARRQWGAIVQSLSRPLPEYEPKLLVILEAADTRLGRMADAQVIAKRVQTLSAEPDGG
jgi:tetratricopeptide (TPR) repeat protein